MIFLIYLAALHIVFQIPLLGEEFRSNLLDNVFSFNPLI